MMDFDVHAWLERKAPGYRDLSPREREAIKTFSLLWSLFEAQALDGSASARAIVNVSEGWEQRGCIDNAAVSDLLLYYRHRYTDGVQLNGRFEHLHLRENDMPDLVRAMLLKHELAPSKNLAAALIIVYRYRNNFFHGIKWAYGFRDQLDNFQASNKLLSMVLDYPN